MLQNSEMLAMVRILSVEDNAICQDRLTLLMDQLEQKVQWYCERKKVIDLFVFLLFTLHVCSLSFEQYFCVT